MAITVAAPSTSLMPAFVGEAMTTVTTMFRSTRKLAEGCERMIDGTIGEQEGVITLLLRQQRLRILSEMPQAPAPEQLPA